MQNQMMKVCANHRFLTLRGQTGLVVLEGETTAVVLFQFAQPDDQLAIELDKSDLTHAPKAKMIREYVHFDETSETFNLPKVWVLERSAPLENPQPDSAKPDSPVSAEDLAEFKALAHSHCEADDDETWVLGLGCHDLRKVLLLQMGCNPKGATAPGSMPSDIEAGLSRTKERLERKRLRLLRELSCERELKDADCHRLRLLQKKYAL